MQIEKKLKKYKNQNLTSLIHTYRAEQLRDLKFIFFSKRLYTRGVAYIEMYGNKDSLMNPNGDDSILSSKMSFASMNKSLNKSLKDLSTTTNTNSSTTTSNNYNDLKNLNITSENQSLFENNLLYPNPNENYNR